MPKFDFGWGSAPDPAGQLTALPRPLAGGEGASGRGLAALSPRTPPLPRPSASIFGGMIDNVP